jgi:hypothetical protein
MAGGRGAQRSVLLINESKKRMRTNAQRDQNLLVLNKEAIEKSVCLNQLMDSAAFFQKLRSSQYYLYKSTLLCGTGNNLMDQFVNTAHSRDNSTGARRCTTIY